MSLRFPEWTARAFGPDHGSEVIARARRLEPRLNAFVAFCENAAPVSGMLQGLPYAAKDIFAAPDRQPCGGLAQPLPRMDCRYADALRLLDAAGAARIGYTALSEIAYEPSGYNAVHGRVRNPWNDEFISGGSSAGSAAAVASGIGDDRARLRHRRLAAHPGACLRDHRLEADLGGGFDARRDAAGADARYHRAAGAWRRRNHARRRRPRRSAARRRRCDQRS